MSPNTLFSQKKPPCEKVFINQLNFQTFSTVFRTSENHRSLLISSTNTEDLARVKYLLTFCLILILPGFDILWYSTWHWYWNYEAILGLDIFWCSSNDFDDLCRSPLTAKLSRDIFVTTTFPLFSDNLPELPLVHLYISTLVYFPEIWVVKYRWSMLRMLGFYISIYSVFSLTTFPLYLVIFFLLFICFYLWNIRYFSSDSTYKI